MAGLGQREVTFRIYRRPDPDRPPDIAIGPLSICSGQRLDVALARGLIGQCDFILALTPLIPRLKAPLLAILEAKRGDFELGLGECAA